MSKTHTTNCRDLIPRSMVFGLILVLLGLLMLANNMAWLVRDDPRRFWPAVLVLLGFVHLINRGPLNISGHILITVGAALLMPPLGYGHLIRQFWPTGIIYVGVIYTLRGFFPNHCSWKTRRTSTDEPSCCCSTASPEKPDDPESQS
jgi:membrane-bound ClpP family serine protease